MTKENCIRLVKLYEQRIDLQSDKYKDQPVPGRGKSTDERNYIRKTATKALANMKKHIAEYRPDLLQSTDTETPPALDTYTKTELLNICRDREIQISKDYTKAELIKILENGT